MITLPARPESLTFAAQNSALIVVDMQNAYASQGGYLDLAGFDVSATRPVIDNINTAVAAARAAGMLIIWFQNGWDDQYMEAGGPGSPNYHKSNALKTMRRRPELQGKLLAKGGWDYQLVDELRPQPGDVVLPKPRYSGFYNTQLDSILRSRGIPPPGVHRYRHQRLRGSPPCADGFFLEYFGIVLEDATHQAGPAFAQQAALFNIETFFGWVSDVAQLLRCPAARQPHPVPGGETLCLNRSLFHPAPPRRSPLSFPARWPMAWCTSPVRCRSISKTTWSISATQRRKPVTFWRPSAALSKRRGAVWRM
ncbi:Peroxyureidoacrylate/ureidoacrylate amidohydrolase RutB [Raoultella terrigena]|uniref:Peroxyureidoacrylate/ureidoacrylate amidohydrolase RutB n=1 Tax=Raoultella terrigena TaxID=577 RepID=A0A485B9M1_RAOTE|nr:Peroxyureidoacrylate/ureidoacrylate amidohydrolase RutB [Raoultella terrigena]